MVIENILIKMLKINILRIYIIIKLKISNINLKFNI